jgi:hypothetical protein
LPIRQSKEGAADSSETEKTDRDFVLKQAEVDLKREELALQKRELDLKEQRYSKWLNPVFLGLAAATLTLLGNIYVSQQQAKATMQQEDRRNRSALLQEQMKAQEPSPHHTRQAFARTIF